jgi:hypothetical protein
VIQFQHHVVHCLRQHFCRSFLNRIASHPLLQEAEDLQTFLEANEETLKANMRPVEVKKQPAQQQGGLGRWFKVGSARMLECCISR